MRHPALAGVALLPSHDEELPLTARRLLGRRRKRAGQHDIRYRRLVIAFNILSFTLMAAVTLPFLLLGALLVATYLDWGIADRLLDAVALSLKALLVVGSGVNFVGGLALIALGIWFPVHAPTLTHWLIGPAIVALGLWRTWRGFKAFPRTE